MRSPENPFGVEKSQILRATVQDRSRRVPKQPRTETGDERKRPTSKKAWAGRLAAVLFLLSNGGLGLKHHIEYNEPLNLQTIERDLLSIPGQWADLLGDVKDSVLGRVGIQTVPETFDNNLDFITGEAGRNAAPVPPGESSYFLINEVQPLDINRGSLPTVSVLFPGRLENGDKFTISTRHVDQAFNPITGKAERITSGKDIIFPRSGTEIAVPVDGAEIFRLHPLIVDNIPYFRGVIIRLKGSDNTIYELLIMAPDDVRQFHAMDNIGNAPILNVRGGQTTPTEKGIILDGGTTIIKTTTPNAHIYFNIGIYSPKYPKGLPTRLEFAVNSENQLLYPSP